MLSGCDIFASLYWYGLLRLGDKSHICIGRNVYISAWASKLLVQSHRAMREPLYVGRVTGKFPRFLFCPKPILILFRELYVGTQRLWRKQ